MRLPNYVLTAVFLFYFSSLFTQIKSVTYIGQNKIQCIAEDDNNIWIGTTGGIIVRHKGTGAVVANYTMASGMPGNDITNIIIDKKGVAWCTVKFIGLVKIDGSSITAPFSDRMSNFDTYTDLALDLSGNKWLLSPWELVKFDDAEWNAFTYSTASPGSSARMAVDNNNNIWIASYVADVILFNTVAKSFIKIADTLTQPLLKGEKINMIANNPADGIMHLGTETGLITCDKGTWAKDPDISGPVYDITFDLYGYAWLATPSGLLQKFGGFVTTYTTADGLVDNNILCVLIDSREIKWAGTGSGLSRYNDVLFLNFTIPTPLQSFIKSVAVDKNDVVWASSSNGLLQFDGASWTALGSGSLFPIGADASNNLWYHDNYTDIGYHDKFGFHVSVSPPGGFLFAALNRSEKIVYVDNSNSFHITAPAASYSHAWLATANDIAQDKAGKYWITTNNGVLCLNGGAWTTYALPGSENAKTIAVGPDGKIWVASDYNLDTLNTSGNSFVTAFAAYTPSADMCFDQLGNLWIAALYDLHKCDGTHFISYDQSSGVIVQYGQSIAVDSKGNKWMGTYEGITVVSCEKPQPSFTSDEVCYLNASPTSLTNETRKQDAFTRYSWDIGNNGSAEYASANAQHDFGGYGTFPVKLIAVNDQCSADTLADVKVSLKPDAAITLTGNNPLCYGKTILLAADIKNDGSLKGFSYQWSGPGVYPDIEAIEVDEQGTYNLSVAFENCTSDTSAVDIVVRKPYDSSSICLVTVDRETAKNKIIWERSPGKRIMSYNVYKKVGSLYVPLGGVPFDSVSQFIDLSSSPEAFSHAYAISTVDSCGNESGYSPVVKTINLLTALSPDTGVIGLHWTAYDDGSSAFDPDYYLIYKGRTKSSLAQFDSVPGNITQFNDLHRNGAMYYQIVVRKPSACSPAIMKAETGPYTQSLSNIVEYKTGSSTDPSSLIPATVYPNPILDFATLEYYLDKPSDVLIEYYNALGEKTSETRSIVNVPGTVWLNIDPESCKFNNGINVIKITAGGKSSIIKCIYSGK